MLDSTAHRRVRHLLTTTLTALAFTAAPALAGENDDDGDDQASAPAQTAPAPAGGVETGLGGTAPAEDGAPLRAGLAACGLLAGAGGLLVLRRRAS